MPELRAWELLLAVARSGSLNAAGREVGISQQAVSARISAVERQTGVQLVARSPRGSTLTPAGVVVAEWAERLLQTAGELDVGLAALRHERQARLRVSASLTIAEHLLPGWLVSLRDAALRSGTAVPEVVLTAANSNAVVEHVRNDQADVGFIEGPSRPRNLRCRVIALDQLVLVVRPDHPWARRRNPITARELAATALVSREEGSGTRDTLCAALRDSLGAEFEPATTALALSTTSAIRAALVAGAGPGVLSEVAVADDLAAGRLTRVAVDGLDLRRRLQAVWQGPAQPPAGPVRELLTHIARRTRAASARP
jgi:molybdate transport repressor ModE-like protein